MKRSFIILISLLAFVGCRHDKDAAPEPELAVEDKDWYILRSPDNRDIKAVHGSIDDTLTITTGFEVFVTADKGKTWTKGSYNAGIGLFAFLEKEDTLFVMEGQRGTTTVRDNSFGIQPTWFSMDRGLTWERATGRWIYDEWKVPINYAYSGNGILFSIDMIQTAEGYLQTIGLKSETGRKISLPAHHQLISVNFDKKSRLYVTGSAPLCGDGNNFEYCDQTNRSGTLYISKKPVLF
ncbi:hypothetical protein [Dyadobacter endophyticus]|uniref:Exo-alpha-sialidase n=1 Tax=Dyadobacter endophyticus TaxID=1749036 RepID=A0ABQ1YKP7_9BACT|nr:hypothetical protein [Dyadobacter endophyticus]GGH29669.1 hypothetical protein GCM10007423_17210 [Dyadobacter endophyticus]